MDEREAASERVQEAIYAWLDHHLALEDPERAQECGSVPPSPPPCGPTDNSSVDSGSPSQTSWMGSAGVWRPTAKSTKSLTPLQVAPPPAHLHLRPSRLLLTLKPARDGTKVCWPERADRECERATQVHHPETTPGDPSRHLVRHCGGRPLTAELRKGCAE